MSTKTKLIICVVVLAFSSIFFLLHMRYAHVLHVAIDAHQDNASLSIEPADMAAHLNKVLDGIEEHEIEGNYAIIFQTSSRDISVCQNRIQNIINRLEELQRMDRSSLAYQQGLDSVSDHIKRLPDIGDHWANKQYYNSMIIFGIVIILVLGFFLPSCFIRTSRRSDY